MPALRISWVPLLFSHDLSRFVSYFVINHCNLFRLTIPTYKDLWYFLREFESNSPFIVLLLCKDSLYLCCLLLVVNNLINSGQLGLYSDCYYDFSLSSAFNSSSLSSMSYIVACYEWSWVLTEVMSCIFYKPFMHTISNIYILKRLLECFCIVEGFSTASNEKELIQYRNILNKKYSLNNRLGASKVILLRSPFMMTKFNLEYRCLHLLLDCFMSNRKTHNHWKTFFIG